MSPEVTWVMKMILLMEILVNAKWYFQFNYFSLALSQYNWEALVVRSDLKMSTGKIAAQ
jgi:hypothetical protein